MLVSLSFFPFYAAYQRTASLFYHSRSVLQPPLSGSIWRGFVVYWEQQDK